MTLREIVDMAVGKQPDVKTTQKNIDNLKKISDNVDEKSKQELEAVAAELLAKKKAEQIEKAKQQATSPTQEVSGDTTAQTVQPAQTAQISKAGKTAQ